MLPMSKADTIIKSLKLIPHPEGGKFIETFKNKNVSLIYYLLKSGETSHWHKLSKDEILHFYDGDPIIIITANSKKIISKTVMGKKNQKKTVYHYVIKSNTWFTMKSTGVYSLIGCTVSPAFSYRNFILAPKNWKPGKKLL